jgi:hypothetical protein
MKNSINFYEQKKSKPVQPSKKTNYINSLIYKEVTTHQTDIAKTRTNKDSKDTIARDKKLKDEEKSTMPSKKSSLNHLNKKGSKNDLSHIDFYNIYHKLTDNFMADTQ